MTLLGRSMFAIGFLGLGCLCFVYQDSILGRPPKWPDGFAAGAAIGYLSGALCIMSATAILLRRRISLACVVIAACLLLFSVTREILFYKNDWLNTCKTLALLGGALIIIKATGDMFNIAVRRTFLFLGTLFLSVFFVASGYAHFKFAAFVTDFIPAYIPFRGFFAYFCGVCLIAGGIGIHVYPVRRLAALLCAVMVTGWFALLHIPRFLADTSNMSDRLGLFESFTFGGIFFVLAACFKRAEN